MHFSSLTSLEMVVTLTSRISFERGFFFEENKQSALNGTQTSSAIDFRLMMLPKRCRSLGPFHHERRKQTMRKKKFNSCDLSLSLMTWRFVAFRVVKVVDDCSSIKEKKKVSSHDWRVNNDWSNLTSARGVNGGYMMFRLHDYALFQAGSAIPMGLRGSIKTSLHFY